MGARRRLEAGLLSPWRERGTLYRTRHLSTAVFLGRGPRADFLISLTDVKRRCCMGAGPTPGLRATWRPTHLRSGRLRPRPLPRPAPQRLPVLAFAAGLTPFNETPRFLSPFRKICLSSLLGIPRHTRRLKTGQAAPMTARAWLRLLLQIGYSIWSTGSRHLLKIITVPAAVPGPSFLGN